MTEEEKKNMTGGRIRVGTPIICIIDFISLYPSLYHGNINYTSFHRQPTLPSLKKEDQSFHNNIKAQLLKQEKMTKIKAWNIKRKN